MKVDIGHKIQEVFETKNIKLTDFADQLGTVRQNVYRIFKKTHLDTGLLLKVSQVLNHNFFQYYVNQPEEHLRFPDLQAQAELKECENRLMLAKKEIDYLRKIIKLMEEKADLLNELDQDTANTGKAHTNAFQ